MAVEEFDPSEVLAIEAPTFTASGVRIVADYGDLSLYFTSNTHAIPKNKPEDTATKVKFTTRIIMSPQNAKVLHESLGRIIELYERMHGPIPPRNIIKDVQS